MGDFHWIFLLKIGCFFLDIIIKIVPCFKCFFLFFKINIDIRKLWICVLNKVLFKYQKINKLFIVTSLHIYLIYWQEDFILKYSAEKPIINYYLNIAQFSRRNTFWKLADYKLYFTIKFNIPEKPNKAVK